jgi:hypothetical protein
VISISPPPYDPADLEALVNTKAAQGNLNITNANVTALQGRREIVAAGTIYIIGSALYQAHGVSSIVDVGVGQQRINLISALQGSTYNKSVTCYAQNSDMSCCFSASDEAGFVTYITNNGGLIDPNLICFSVLNDVE